MRVWNGALREDQAPPPPPPPSLVVGERVSGYYKGPLVTPGMGSTGIFGHLITAEGSHLFLRGRVLLAFSRSSGPLPPGAQISAVCRFDHGSDRPIGLHLQVA